MSTISVFAGAGSEKLSESFERIAPEESFLAEAGADKNDVHHFRERGGVPDQVMKGLVDRRRAQERHHDRFHEQFERTAERDPDRQTADPALWPHVTDVAPRRAREPCPDQHENCA
jgi:hypothetical protein